MMWRSTMSLYMLIICTPPYSWTAATLKISFDFLFVFKKHVKSVSLQFTIKFSYYRVNTAQYFTYFEKNHFRRLFNSFTMVNTNTYNLTQESLGSVSYRQDNRTMSYGIVNNLLNRLTYCFKHLLIGCIKSCVPFLKAKRFSMHKPYEPHDIIVSVTRVQAVISPINSKNKSSLAIVTDILLLIHCNLSLFSMYVLQSVTKLVYVIRCIAYMLNIYLF